MWRILLTILQNVITLTRDVDDNRREIKELNEKVFALASDVRSLSDRVESESQRGALERKTLILQLENELLKTGRKVHLLKSRKKTQPREQTQSKK